MPRWMAQALLPLLVGGLFLLGLAAIGKITREKLREQERYTFAFADIDCTPPPGQERERFLDEVLMPTGQPDRFSLLEENLADRLAEAFAHHPWVEHVDRVTVMPSRQVQVQLTYRTPVLAVTLGTEKRAVDEKGILLPPRAVTAGLPVLESKVAPPTGLSGSAWGDAAVEAAARTAGHMRPQQSKVHVTSIEVMNENTVVLRTSAGARIVWGRPPGAERPGEASADQKLDRLLRLCAADGDLDKLPRKDYDLSGPAE